MARVHAFFYRIYYALRKSATQGVLRRWPTSLKVLDHLKRLPLAHLLPRAQVWVRIQSGLSKGMWMQINLPGEAFLWRGDHEPEVQNAISVAVCPGTVFYDVGAHVGTMALGAANLVGESGCVVAFDGDPENIKRLRLNSERNGFQARLRVLHAVVWSRTNSDGIPFRRGTTAKSQGGVEADGNRPVLGKGDVISVPAITLDDYIASGAPSPRLIKIDVEGGEYEVLIGGERVFTVQRPFIIVEIHHQRAAALITAWLDQHQYCGNWEIPKEGFPRRLFGWPTEQDGQAWMRARIDRNRSQEGPQ